MHRRSLLGVAAGAAATLTGCTRRAPLARGPVLKPITYMTGFGVLGRDGYAWAAREHGFFRDAGLNVTIQPGSGPPNLVKLAGKRADFVSVDYTNTLVSISRHVFPDLRMVAVIHQQTLLSLLSLASRHITTPLDLPGLHALEATNATTSLLWPAYARQAGIDPASVRWTQGAIATLNPALASGKTDVVGQFLVAAPSARAAAKGAPVNVLPYSDYLRDLYGSSIVARKGMDQGVVRDFVQALMRGLRYAVDNPRDVGAMLQKVDPIVDPLVAAQELMAMKPYVPKLDAGQGLGAMDPYRVARSIALVRSVGLIKDSPSPGDVANFTAVLGASPAPLPS